MQKRVNTPEMMDDFSGAGEELVGALQELDMINKWLGGDKVTLSGVEYIVNKARPVLNKTPFRIFDAGCGSGTQLKLIANWFRRNQIPVELVGVDANAVIADIACENCKGYPEISIKNADVFDALSSNQPDLICSTLFCHHFPEPDLKALIQKWYADTCYAVLINDLHRHVLAYSGITLLTRALSGSAMVRNDAPLSVKRGFSRKELKHVFQKAGVDQLHISWKWAFRYQVIALKD